MGRSARSCCWRSAGVGVFVYYYEMPTARDIDVAPVAADGAAQRHRQGHRDAPRSCRSSAPGRRSRSAPRQPQGRAAGGEGRRRSAAPHADVAATQSNLTIKSFKPAPTVDQAAARRVADQPRSSRARITTSRCSSTASASSRASSNISGPRREAARTVRTRTRRSPRTCVRDDVRAARQAGAAEARRHAWRPNRREAPRVPAMRRPADSSPRRRAAHTAGRRPGSSASRAQAPAPCRPRRSAHYTPPTEAAAIRFLEPSRRATERGGPQASATATASGRHDAGGDHRFERHSAEPRTRSVAMVHGPDNQTYIVCARAITSPTAP